MGKTEANETGRGILVSVAPSGELPTMQRPWPLREASLGPSPDHRAVSKSTESSRSPQDSGLCPKVVPSFPGFLFCFSFLFCLAVLGTEPRVQLRPGKKSTVKSHPSPPCILKALYCCAILGFISFIIIYLHSKTARMIQKVFFKFLFFKTPVFQLN